MLGLDMSLFALSLMIDEVACHACVSKMNEHVIRQYEILRGVFHSLGFLNLITPRSRKSGPM
jgi:hypothetical protein